MRKQSSKTSPTVVPFRSLFSGNAAAGVESFDLSPGNGVLQRVSAIGNLYQLYRITKLQFRLHPYPRISTGASGMSLAFYPGGVQVAPSSWADNVEAIHACVIYMGASGSGDLTTKPTKWCHVPEAALRGPLPWYKTVPSASVDTWEETAATLRLACSSAVNTDYIFEVMGVFEFKDPLDADVSLSRERQLAALRQRMALILAGQDPASAGSGTPAPVNTPQPKLPGQPHRGPPA